MEKSEGDTISPLTTPFLIDSISRINSLIVMFCEILLTNGLDAVEADTLRYFTPEGTTFVVVPL
jgi:hypothetical protein